MFSLWKTKSVFYIFVVTQLILSIHEVNGAPQSELLFNTADDGSALVSEFVQSGNGTNTTDILNGDACSSNPCIQGTCFENGTEYHCFCRSGYTGKNCENTLDACSKNPCLRGLCLHHHGDYYCVCPSGFSGKNCQSTINPCNSDPCVRGVCYHYQTEFHCDCPTGYYGKKCEQDNNECISQPCKNGGVCIDGIGNYSCNCSSGFTGDQCQTELDECSSKPCLNSGVCKDGINSFTCECPTGYGGDRCQNVTDPCKYSPCRRGTCFARLSQFICMCPSGYTGKLCEDTIKLTLYGPKEVFIKIPVGNQLNLNCSVSGDRITIQWSKRRGCGHTFKSNRYSSDFVNRISNTDIGDAGTYICKASNSYTLSVVMKVFHVDIAWSWEACSFEDGRVCGWSKHSTRRDSGTEVSWYNQQGSSTSNRREQYSDHTLGTLKGRFMEIDAHLDQDYDSTAFLKSHIFPANRTVCFEFWYRVSGQGYGKLSMTVEDTCLSKETELVHFMGDQGRSWHKADVTISHKVVPNDFYIILKSDIRNSFRGYMAVDDLKISDGSCQGFQGQSLIG